MGLKNFFSSGHEIEPRSSYNFLVVSALQEELNAFYALFKNLHPEKKEADAYEIRFCQSGQDVKILTYTPNRMGMPFNAAAIMNIIAIHQPTYVFMIGTCACIGQKHNFGDVLIPSRVFSYESGKFSYGRFKPDYEAQATSDKLRKQAEYLKGQIHETLSYSVTTDEDFCSGAAVINDDSKISEITERCGRKLAGLDMESYSIACINSILQGGKELTVIKGISDYALKKELSEEKGKKKLAMKNSAHYTLELIKHFQATEFGPPTEVQID